MGKKNKALKKRNRELERQLADHSMDSMSGQISPSGGWSNSLNDFGPNTDPTFDTIYLPPYEFTFRELTNLYQNPLVHRVISLHAGDGTRKGFELQSKNNADQARDIKKEMDKRFNWLALGAKMIGIRHNYGGGVLFADVDDGRLPEEPINENAVRKVWSFQPIESFYAHPVTSRPLFDDEKPGQPLHYMITIQGFGQARAFKCHESRLIRFPTFESDDVLSQNERIRRRTWPFSTVQLIYDGVKRYGIGMQSESQLLESFVEDVFKVANLKSLKDLEGMRTYAREQRALRNSLRMTIIGKDDDVEKKQYPITGLKEITKDQRMDVGMITEIPVPVLFNEESKGLGGSALPESRKMWFDNVASRQKIQYTPLFERMLEIVSYETGWDIEDITIVWNPLSTPDDKDKVEMRKSQAETDKIYWEMGLPETNILKSRFGGEEVDLDSMDFDAEQFEKDLKEFNDAAMKEAKEQLDDLQKREDQEGESDSDEITLELEK